MSPVIKRGGDKFTIPGKYLLFILTIVAVALMVITLTTSLFSGIANTMGLSVPGDVIITGLNGINNRRSGVPDVTDTKRNFTLQADKCLEIIEKMIANPEDCESISSVRIPEEIHLSESCGCGRMNDIPNSSEFIRFLILQREFARRASFLNSLF